MRPLTRVLCALAATTTLLMAGSAAAQSYDVLLVDDDGLELGETGDLQSLWTDSLTTIGAAYTVVDITAGEDQPTTADMQAHDLVVWFTGENFTGWDGSGLIGPNGDGLDAMLDYLDAGGRLLFSSQDYLYTLGGTADELLDEYLGVDANRIVSDDVMMDEGVYGVPGDPVSGGHLSPAYSFDDVEMQNYADSMHPDVDAVGTYMGINGQWDFGVVRKLDASYRTMFWSAPFSPLFSDPVEAAEVLADSLAFLMCDESDADGDGWSECDGDCDDGNAAVHPFATEICNDGVDQNCDGVTDEWTDNDGDGFSTCTGDCDDNNPDNRPGNAEVCDYTDNDCDGAVDELPDMDGDGYSECDDCDDTDDTINPGAEEICNGVDDDCNAYTDETWDLDADGYSLCDGDCNDDEAAVNPGAAEDCDGIADNNCDGVDHAAEIDQDGDGYSEWDGDC